MRALHTLLTGIVFLLAMTTLAMSEEMSGQRGGIPQRLTILENQVTVLERFRSRVLGQLDLLRARITELEHQVSTLEAQGTELETRLMTLEARDAEWEARITALEQVSRVPHIVDALGQVVGTILDQANVFNGATNSSGNKTVLFEAAVLVQIQGIPAIVRVTPTTITGFPSAEGSDTRQLNFTGPDCIGTAFVRGTVRATFGGHALSWAGNLHIPKPIPGVDTDVNRDIVLRSRVAEDANGQLVCENDTFRTVYTEALTVPLSIFDGFVPPFTIAGMPDIPSP